MELINKNSDLKYYLSSGAERSFLVLSRKSTPTSITVNDLKLKILSYFTAKGMNRNEVNSHIFSIEDEGNKEKLKKVIKKFENNLINKPANSLLNIGIIDFDFLKKTTNEFQRLLKLLEEPPKSTQIYIVSKESKNIPKTIKSRLITIGHLEKTNKDKDTQKGISINFDEALNDTAKKVNSLSTDELEEFLSQTISLNKLIDMNFNQLIYIQNLITKASKYKKINLKPLDSELGVLKKLIKEK